MNYLNFFCSECKHHGHNVSAVVFAIIQKWTWRWTIIALLAIVLIY